MYEALAFAFWPKEYLELRFRRHGEGFGLQLPGLGRICVAGRSQGAQQLFSATPDTFGRLQNSPAEPILGSQSLMLIAGPHHLESRRLLSPPFHGQNMKAFGQSIQTDTLRHLSAISENFVLQDLTKSIALDVIIACVFGVQDTTEKTRFHRAISQMMQDYTTPLMLLPFLRFSFLGLSPWDRFCRSKAAVHQLFRGQFERHATDNFDILGRLLSLNPRPEGEALLSILCTLLVAGHETSAIGMTWALYFLHRHPHSLERLREEIQHLGTDPEQLLASPYLKAVCQESLRLNPSVPAALRTLRKPLLFCGQERPPGTNVAVSLTLLHSDPEIFPSPSEFRPERFLGRKYSPFAYAPFGGGYRRCIGESFALYEMCIVLGTIVSESRLKMCSPGRVRALIRGIAMAPSRRLHFRRL